MRSNRCIPASIVIPEIPYPDPSEAAKWLAAAFGFTVRLRIANHRIQMHVGTGSDLGAIVVTDRRPITPASVLIRVEDIDAHHARAAAHGASIRQPPITFEYGERQYSAQDFAGHFWNFSETMVDTDPLSFGFEPG